MGIDYSRSFGGTVVTAYSPQKRDRNPAGRLDSGWTNISAGIITDRDRAVEIARQYKKQNPSSEVRVKKTERRQY